MLSLVYTAVMLAGKYMMIAGNYMMITESLMELSVLVHKLVSWQVTDTCSNVTPVSVFTYKTRTMG